MNQISLSDAEVAELNAPLSHKEAMDHLRLGFARALSDANFMPEDIELMLKSAANGIMQSLMDLTTEHIPLAFAVGGAGIGAYAGYAHANLDQMLAGKDDPKIVELKRKIDAYRNMSDDLRRTSKLDPAMAAQ